jgi:predicted ester cyclase
MTPAENESLVQEFYDQWNSGAIDFDRLIHPEIANHQPEREPEVGSEAFRKAIDGVMQAVPDSNWTTLRLFAAADLVFCHNRWSGTWNGTVFRGVPTLSGKRFSVEHMHVYRIANRQLVEHWVVRDDLAMMSQVGGLPR